MSAYLDKEAADRIAALKAEIERLDELVIWANKVIEPFANAAGAYEREPEAYCVGHRNTVADLRAAHAFRDRDRTG